jgi:hypothetical protein
MAGTDFRPGFGCSVFFSSFSNIFGIGTAGHLRPIGAPGMSVFCQPAVIFCKITTNFAVRRGTIDTGVTK